MILKVIMDMRPSSQAKNITITISIYSKAIRSESHAKLRIKKGLWEAEVSIRGEIHQLKFRAILQGG